MKIRSQILKYMHLDRTYCLLTGKYCSGAFLINCFVLFCFVLFCFVLFCFVFNCGNKKRSLELVEMYHET